MSADDDHRLSPQGALLGLPMLRMKSVRIADSFARLAVEIRLLQANLDAALDALSPHGAAALDDSAFRTVVHVPLGPLEFRQAELAIEAMQEADPDKSLDECVQEVFLRGLASYDPSHCLRMAAEEEHF